MKDRQKLGILAALGLAISLWLSCSREAVGPGANGAAPGAGAGVPVLAAEAIQRDVPVMIEAIGNVQAYSQVSIRPQVTGPIMEAHFEEGQEVEEGQLLFTIDPRPYEAALNQARAALVRDQAQLVSARLEFERTSNLFVSRVASQQDFDTADAAYSAWRGTVQVDQAAISNAEVNLSYTVIRAPIDGRTGDLFVKKGSVVKAPDDVLVTVAQVQPIYAAFSIPERFLPPVRRQWRQSQMKLRVTVPGEEDRPVLGELTFINNMVDTNTGMILMKGTFANTESVLWPGQFVQVSLTVSNLAGATLVPTQAVQAGQNGDFVFVVKSDKTVEFRRVVTGIDHEGFRVIQSGVAAGEMVVTDGQLRLKPGARVEVTTPAAVGMGASTRTANRIYE